MTDIKTKLELLRDALAVANGIARNPGCKFPKGSGSALVCDSIIDYRFGADAFIPLLADAYEALNEIGWTRSRVETQRRIARVAMARIEAAVAGEEK